MRQSGKKLEVNVWKKHQINGKDHTQKMIDYTFQNDEFLFGELDTSADTSNTNLIKLADILR